MSSNAPAILYVHDLRATGVVTNAIALARRMGGERETILCAGFGGGLNHEVDVSPAQLVVLDRSREHSRSRLAPIQRLGRLIQDRDASLIVSMGNFGHSTVFAATLWRGIHTVYRISNEIGRPRGRLVNFSRWAWQRLLLATADRVVLVGGALARQPLFAAALKSGQATYIPNGVDLARARHAAMVVPPPHPWLTDEGPPVVVSIGRLHPQKNLEKLIDALAIARRSVPMRLVLLGSGAPEWVDRLRRRATTLGIGASLQLVGETDNVFIWLARASLFALVSRWEGSSNALLEAMAVDVPIVASRQAGDASEVLGDGRFGVLVDADDPAAIAEGLIAQARYPVRPGDRVNDFALSRTHERYLALLRPL